ncbi:uncharacterized protein EV422DRAFT_518041 [Fimicolochytrium jonesii]|uniref:uncharacterized protein n=1 Tax=Fimicolochytrium jonesii TaxID=1396493 RepID=UPI0022FE55A1|nr:uncharacterized protein EV422DRAFT_518041 [Fimicolochytrium jonesii]KAI8825241.1 hypothetical protein EV422DRAFT_518041 [Fimicolochytrium jonesii]
MSLIPGGVVSTGSDQFGPPQNQRPPFPRNNVLQLPQIHKELASLQKSLDQAQARIQKEDSDLLNAQRRAVKEMEETFVEESFALEGVELEKAEEEQEILLHGARSELNRHEHHNHLDGGPAGGAGDENLDALRHRHEARLPRHVEEKEKWQQHTSEMYRTTGHMPHRFERPALWRYEIPGHHPLYSTTSGDYGKSHPTVHEMPVGFHGVSSKFTKHVNQAGPYRNNSLNTA